MHGAGKQRAVLVNRPADQENFLVKLFSKSCKEYRLSEKRRHPKTFII
ncbi:hypothetical protein SXCC_03696 [Gluconacetobacter sp. SXCC-1]|nr:hypothetical protein SXCC_03696 [Gluconacetobacter sp. SXCC-1]